MKAASTSNMSGLANNNIFLPLSHFCNPPPSAPIIIMPVDIPTAPPAEAEQFQTTELK